MSEWIKVEDELPTQDRAILLCHDDGEMTTGYLCLMTSRFKNDYNDILDDIAYWQILPEPPKDN